MTTLNKTAKAALAATLLISTFGLASPTLAQSNETFADPAIYYGLMDASQKDRTILEDCLSEESSSRAVRACSKAYANARPDDALRANLVARRGLHQLALGRYDKASRDFDRAGELNGESDLSLIGEGFTAIMQKDLSTAEMKFRDCSGNDQFSSLAQYGLGITYQMAGDTVEAKEAYKRAAELRPGWTAPVERINAL